MITIQGFWVEAPRIGDFETPWHWSRLFIAGTMVFVQTKATLFRGHRRQDRGRSEQAGHGAGHRLQQGLAQAALAAGARPVGAFDPAVYRRLERHDEIAAA